jgi:alcohol dehydrogenase class IV
LVHGLPIIAVPTTYAGSEMTPVWGLAEIGGEADRPRRAGAAAQCALRPGADPHARTHTVVLPHALAFNQSAAPEAVAALSRALGGVDDPARELWQLVGRLGAPRSLRELGMVEADIPRIADLAVAAPYANPRPVTADGLMTLLHAAWAGELPQG